MSNFSAVLLAGGRSSRMGRDKAEILLPGGRPLWCRQLDDVLRPLNPAEVFLSGPARAGLPPDVRALADDLPGLGPLSGIAAALGAIRTPLLIVLAVDLPLMTPTFFQERLFPVCGPGRGAVGRNHDGYFEPLAAVYPRTAYQLALERLRGGKDLSLQAFVRATVTAGLITPAALHADDSDRFINWNRPEDVPTA